jgi:abhydrolase domain-containing protein 12
LCLTNDLSELLDKILIHKFATIELLPNVTAPILLIHGEDDTDIIIKHSQMLFDATIEPYLEQYPFTRQELSQVRMPTEEQRELVAAISKRRHEQTKKLVTEEQWGALGSFYEAERPGKGRVQLFRSTWGGHDDIINFETVMDVARVSFKL